jgi:agmatine deiminase
MPSSFTVVWFSELLKTQFPLLYSEIAFILSNREIAIRTLKETNDIWCRDYLPVSDGRGGFVQFRFNPSYLNYKKYRHLITHPVPLHNQIGITPAISSLVLDGGNVVRSSKTVVMSDIVLKDNPGWSEVEIRNEIISRLNVGKVVILPHQSYDFTGHADGMVRLLDDKRILVNDYSKESKKFRKKVWHLLDNAELSPITFPYGMDYSYYDSKSAIGTYINFLIISNTILLPTFGLPEDDTAEKIIKENYPANEIVRINCRLLAKEGGVLNCIGWVQNVQ